LSDLKAELEQLAMDARRTPKLVLQAHLPDQRAQF
jgi:predicted transcriptional regulator